LQGRAEEGPTESRAELDRRIDRAVASGNEALVRRLAGLLEAAPADYPMGRLALAVAALLKSGTPSDHPRIQAAFEKLAQMPLEKTYCVACYLFALDALGKRRKDETRATDGPGATTPLETGPQAAGAERKRMEACVRWLVEAQVPGHGSWTYSKGSKGSRHDFSNTQFAALGLQIGVEHGIEVPREVFVRLADLFARSLEPEGSPAEWELTLATALEEKLRATRVSGTRRYRVASGGWAYTDQRGKRVRREKRDPAKGDNDENRTGPEPYASMTAAGASSLIIALRALGVPLRSIGTAAARPPAADPRAVADAERALLAAYAWITRRFDDYLEDGRQIFYTLYSLEKAGDLGGVERFGGRSWYEEGARRLLERERPGGGWGTYIDTSFALLFLTRATQPLEARAAPALYTGGEGKPARGGAKDLVYIDRVGGFLSAREVLAYAGEVRGDDVTALCEEVVRHYPPNSAEDLAPLLLPLWSKPDRVTAFARKALAEVTGIRSGDRKAYEAWCERLESVRAIEGRTECSPDEVAALLRAAEGPRLKSRVVNLAQRRNLRALAGLLIEELSVPSPEYRAHLHGVLILWTARPIEAPRGPAAERAEAWERTIEEWRVWWAREGRAFVEGVR
jgi:hypothetical protein